MSAGQEGSDFSPFSNLYFSIENNSYLVKYPGDEDFSSMYFRPGLELGYLIGKKKAGSFNLEYSLQFNGRFGYDIFYVSNSGTFVDVIGKQRFFFIGVPLVVELQKPNGKNIGLICNGNLFIENISKLYLVNSTPSSRVKYNPISLDVGLRFGNQNRRTKFSVLIRSTNHYFKSFSSALRLKYSFYFRSQKSTL